MPKPIAVLFLTAHLFAAPREPATSPTIEVVGSTTAPATSPHAPGPATVLPKRVHIPQFGVRFSIPGDFVAGRFAPTTGGVLDGAAVFVEQRIAQGIDAQRIPAGAVPVVFITRAQREERQVFESILDQSWKTRIGPHEVYKLPGYPAPFGDDAHCYFLPRGNAGGLIMYAHRMRPRDAEGDRASTHYDWVAEGIIATMEFQD
jgi:hypothetical protein